MTAFPGLHAWTTEQLLAEVLKRASGDTLSLRLMQRMILQARLSAYDRRLPAVPE